MGRRKKADGAASYAEERREAVLDGVREWASYYRANINRFVEDYFHIKLKLFQAIILLMMDKCSNLVFIACRGIGKTWLGAVFCCARCILYPTTKICVASGIRPQAINLLEMALGLRANSPELAKEINDRETNINNTTAKITFKNGSYIKVVTASDNARSNRANILILDEFRLIKKDTIDTILRRFLAGGRHPQYLDLPEYEHREDLVEHNKTLYLSSAYYEDHWSYTRCKDSCRFMLDDQRSSFVCGMPYQLAIKEGLLIKDDVADEMAESDFSEIKWGMEIGFLSGNRSIVYVHRNVFDKLPIELLGYPKAV